MLRTEESPCVDEACWSVNAIIVDEEHLSDGGIKNGYVFNWRCGNVVHHFYCYEIAPDELRREHDWVSHGGMILFKDSDFPIHLFYLIFLRHTIKSVTPAQVEKLKSWKILNTCSDLFTFALIRKAKDFVTRFSLFKKGWLDKINIPVHPEGNFRIGVDN